MLLDRGGGEPGLELLDVGGDGDGLDGSGGVSPRSSAPAEELGDGLGVGGPGVGVGDVGGEELDEPLAAPSPASAMRAGRPPGRDNVMGTRMVLSEVNGPRVPPLRINVA